MPNEPAWLSAEQVVTINRRLVALTGEPFLVLNAGSLESACAKPRNRWNYGEEDVAALACSLLFGIARNHPFAQGNKRTAFTAAVALLDANGFRLRAPDTYAFADAIVAVLQHEMSEEAFAEELRDHLEEIA